jgi:CubicO group peptidase (beta-lactamase class C family)
MPFIYSRAHGVRFQVILKFIMKKTLTTVTFFALSILVLQAQVLTPAKPESVGLSSERLNRVDHVIQEYINQQWIPGAVVLIARNGKIVHHKAFGSYTADKKTILKKDAIFRIASQTKAITSVAVMMLYEEGKFLLDDRISKYIPEFAKPTVLKTFNEADSSYTTEPAKNEITIRHLLTHTSGLDYASIGSNEFKAIYAKAGVHSGIGTADDRLADKIKILGKLPLKHNPGERFTYSLSTDVLGYLVEVVSGLSLDEFFKKRIFIPLGMSDTYFYLPKEKHNRLVDLYTEHEGKVVPAKDILNEADPDFPKSAGTYFSGGAGLSSTIEDYAKFLQMLVNGGVYNGNRLLSRKTVELMTTNQLGDKITDTFQFSLGFSVETAKNDHLSPATIGSISWGGAFSTTYWADPKEKLVALLFMQMIPNSHREIQEKFKTLTYQSFND